MIGGNIDGATINGVRIAHVIVLAAHDVPGVEVPTDATPNEVSIAGRVRVQLRRLQQRGYTPTVARQFIRQFIVAEAQRLNPAESEANR
jgi:hypothetical protein